jgi:hypothetical protein
MTNTALDIRDDMPLMDLGKVLAGSGFFADTRDAGQAIVKVLAGRELGLPAIASMTGIYIVKGRVAVSANLMAAAVKRTSKYNYRILEHTDKVCELAFWEDGKEVGRSRFTAEDAKRAGTQNMDRFPRNMLFARAMSNGVKWFCADVFGGPVYTPEEMGAKEDGDGDVIEMPTQASKPANGNGHTDLQPPVEDEADLTGEMPAEYQAPVTPTRPYAPETLKAGILKAAVKHAKAGKAATPGQRGLLVGTLNDCFMGQDVEECRHLVTLYLTGEASSKAVPDAFVLAILDWLKPTKDTTGAYVPDPMAEREAALVLRQARIDAGQPELLPQ